jgi:hypothetical protein
MYLNRVQSAVSLHDQIVENSRPRDPSSRFSWLWANCIGLSPKSVPPGHLEVPDLYTRPTEFAGTIKRQSFSNSKPRACASVRWSRNMLPARQGSFDE